MKATPANTAYVSWVLQSQKCTLGWGLRARVAPDVGDEFEFEFLTAHKAESRQVSASHLPSELLVD